MTTNRRIDFKALREQTGGRFRDVLAFYGLTPVGAGDQQRIHGHCMVVSIVAVLRRGPKPMVVDHSMRVPDPAAALPSLLGVGGNGGGEGEPQRAGDRR